MQASEVEVCCNLLQCGAMWCIVLHCVALCVADCVSCETSARAPVCAGV